VCSTPSQVFAVALLHADTPADPIAQTSGASARIAALDLVLRFDVASTPTTRMIPGPLANVQDSRRRFAYTTRHISPKPRGAFVIRPDSNGIDLPRLA
jgi:hypothetical protein